MNRTHYMEKGAQAYRNGRTIIFGTIDAKFWQRRAFMDGYRMERESWKAANPGTDEWNASANRSADFCRAMVTT